MRRATRKDRRRYLVPGAAVAPVRRIGGWSIWSGRVRNKRGRACVYVAGVRVLPARRVAVLARIGGELTAVLRGRVVDVRRVRAPARVLGLFGARGAA